MDYPISVPSVGLVGGKFVDENPGAGTPGSLIPAQWGNSITDEVINVIESAGLVPDEENSAQLIQAIRLLSQLASERYAVDTGSANIYTASYDPVLAAMVDGMVLRFKAKTTNTGASTFSPNGLTAKPVVGLNKTALQGFEIIANGECAVVWSAPGDHWILLSSTGGALQIPAPSKSNQAVPFSWLPKRIFTSNDYIRIPDVPGGLIIQWGAFDTGAIGNSATGTQTLPSAHPNAHLQTIVGSVAGVTGGTATSEGFYVSALSLSNFTWSSQWASRDNAVGSIRYISFGY